jgi:hypothetical protein
MAAATPLVPPNTTQNTLLKLDSDNYTSWLTQINPILRTHELMGFVDGSEPCPPKTIIDDEGKATPNPKYHTWNKKDQYLQSVITRSLSEKNLATVYGLNTSQQAWTSLATKFASKSKSRISNLKKQLQSLTQGPKSCADYLQSAKHLADQLNATGNPIPKEEIITSILHGLNSSFTHFITTYSFHTRANEISFEDFQDELLSHELMLNQQQQQATDHSFFALTAQGPPQFQTFKGKTPMPVRFPQRKFSPRPNNGYPSPRPYSHQFSRGPP